MPSCFICHRHIETGQTSADIHTGCLALLTPNREVERWLAGAREEGKEAIIDAVKTWLVLNPTVMGFVEKDSLLDEIQHIL